MPGRDGTGRMGLDPLTGARRGHCADAVAPSGRGGGRGWRNQFYATGLTGWQRAAQADALAGAPIGDTSDPFTSLESKLAEVIERLDRLEVAGRD